MRDKIIKTDAEWRAQLTPEQYQVTRAHGTERAFTGRWTNIMRTALIVASVAKNRCSHPIQNSIRAAAGKLL